MSERPPHDMDLCVNCDSPRKVHKEFAPFAGPTHGCNNFVRRPDRTFAPARAPEKESTVSDAKKCYQVFCGLYDHALDAVIVDGDEGVAKALADALTRRTGRRYDTREMATTIGWLSRKTSAAGSSATLIALSARIAARSRTDTTGRTTKRRGCSDVQRSN